MRLDKRHIDILKDIAGFARVERYRGMMPSKLALCYDGSDVDALVDADLVERMRMTYACGLENTFFKLTDAGMQLLEELARQEQELTQQEKDAGVVRLPQTNNEVVFFDECLELNEEQRQILADIWHFSNIRRFCGMMPASELEEYPPREVNTLFARGFIVQVKAELGSSGKHKGLILSSKGLRCVRQ